MASAAASDGPDAGRRGRPPGSSDVARLVGVSQKTVSRVMNGEPHVKDEVRERVLRAAQELGYRRNNAARALTSGRHSRIGVVTLGTALHGPATLLVGLERAARSTGYALSIVNTFEDEPGGVAGAVEALLRQGVDGIVFSEPVDEGSDGATPGTILDIVVDVPVLVLGTSGGPSAPRVISADATNGAGAGDATRHLLSLGHRTVAHVAGPQAWFSARERLEGWRAALRDAGAEEPPPVEGDWSAASGHAAARRLLERAGAAPGPTAVFAANDDMAIGVVHALVEAGLSVPRDVSVVGFDDIPIAPYTNPPLTTVAQPIDAVARRGLTALVHSIEHPQDPVPPVLESPTRLVVRGSTAPPPARRATADAPTPSRRAR